MMDLNLLPLDLQFDMLLTRLCCMEPGLNMHLGMLEQTHEFLKI